MEEHEYYYDEWDEWDSYIDWLTRDLYDDDTNYQLEEYLEVGRYKDDE